MITNNLVNVRLVELHKFEQVLIQITKHAQKAHLKETSAGFTVWLSNAVLKGAGAAHRYTTAFMRPVVDETLQGEGTGGTLASPVELIRAKEQFWSSFWKPVPADTLDGINTLPDQHWLADLWAKAQQDLVDWPPVTVKKLEGVLKHSPAKAGPGGDIWRAHDWSLMPYEGKVMLTDMINEAEHTLSFPVQVLCNIVVLQPKPAGGDRPICLTSAFYRAWSGCRKEYITQWDTAHSNHWDSAVRGSSPLRAAMHRAFSNELCLLSGISVVQVLFDIAKFYDSIHLPILIRKALALGYPAIPLHMAIMNHMAARLISANGSYSNYIMPSDTSILAGCTQSTCWAKCLLYDIMSFAHSKYKPVSIHMGR